MKTIRHIVLKEFRQLRRNTMLMRLLFIMPAIQLIVLSFAADFEIKKVKLAVVDQDLTQSSSRLIGKFTASGYFTNVHRSLTVSNALSEVEHDQADIIIVIKHKFEEQLQKNFNAKVQVLANAVNNQKAAVASNYARLVINLFNKEEMNRISAPASLIPETIHISEGFWYNPRLNYKTFMVPGILAVLVTMLTAFLSSVSIIREKEIGTIEQLNVTPIKKYQFIIGKLIPFWVIGLMILTIGLILAYVIFGISVQGSYLLLYGFVSLYLIAILGFGTLISTIAETQQQAMFMTWFFTVIFILMSGLFTPRDGMPEWANVLNIVNPLRYFVDVNRMIMLKGSSFSDVSWYFAVMACFAFALNYFAIRIFRKTAN